MKLGDRPSSRRRRRRRRKRYQLAVTAKRSAAATSVIARRKLTRHRTTPCCPATEHGQRTAGQLPTSREVLKAIREGELSYGRAQDFPTIFVPAHPNGALVCTPSRWPVRKRSRDAWPADEDTVINAMVLRGDRDQSQRPIYMRQGAREARAQRGRGAQEPSRTTWSTPTKSRRGGRKRRDSRPDPASFWAKTDEPQAGARYSTGRRAVGGLSADPSSRRWAGPHDAGAAPRGRGRPGGGAAARGPRAFARSIPIRRVYSRASVLQTLASRRIAVQV